MAPTEATILSTFLLPPAPLPTIISLKAFTELFPRSQQSSPQIKALYRDLQHQRIKLTDAVTRNIAAEIKRGNEQRRAVVRARRESEKEDPDDEVEIENAVSSGTLVRNGNRVANCECSFSAQHQIYPPRSHIH
jgi:centromere-localized protein 2